MTVKELYNKINKLRTVWTIIEYYSPELQAECGKYYVWGTYDTYDKAKAALKKQIEFDVSSGFLLRDKGEDYALMYKDDNEDSALWSEYRIVKNLLE